jgi:hypothetical protein
MSGIWVPPGGSADLPREQPAQPPPPDEPELTAEQLAEAVRRMRVSDLLLSTMSTMAQLAYAKLDPASRDLGQAHLAIETLRALVPVLEGAVPEEVVRDFRQVIANLQIAYASAVAPPAAGEEGLAPD